MVGDEAGKVDLGNGAGKIKPSSNFSALSPIPNIKSI